MCHVDFDSQQQAYNEIACTEKCRRVMFENKARLYFDRITVIIVVFTQFQEVLSYVF